MKIAAVVVTRNRIILLKKLIYSLRIQKVQFNEIIIVNNDSNDGTTEWLKEQNDLTVINQENLGSSGGQYSGLKYAFENEFDWVWCSDDDITLDDVNFLEKFIDITKELHENTLAIGCHQVLDDGSSFIMSQKFSRIRKDIVNVKYDLNKILIPTEIISFAGVFFNKNVYVKVGLPRKELFISYDDAEYSSRISKKGKLFSCLNLIVHHHLVFNKNTNFGLFGNRIYDKSSEWRKFYHKRNYYITLLSFEKSIFVYLRIFYRFSRSAIYILLVGKKKRENIKIEFKAMYEALTNKLTYINNG